MIRAKVTDKIWSSRRIKTVPSGALLEVEIEGGSKLIAFDPLGCDFGESVLIVQGSTAATYFSDSSAPIDALIIGSIDDGAQKKQPVKQTNLSKT